MGMDHRYGSCPLKGYGSWVWIMGYGSHVVPGYGSEPYILSRSHIYILLYIILRKTLPNQNQFDGPVTGPDELPKIYVHSRFAYLCLTKQALFAHANVACHK